MTENKNAYWLLAAIAAAFIAVFVFAIVTYVNTIAVRESERKVVQSYAIREATSAMLSAMTNAETGQRGFLLTGDPVYLTLYETGVERAEESLVKLQQATIDDPWASREVAKLHEAFEKQKVHLDETISLRRAQSQDRISDEVLALVQSGRGKAAMDTAREAVGSILSEQELILTKQESFARGRTATTRTTITVGNLLALGLILFAGVAAYQYRQKRDQAESDLLGSLERQREFAAILGQVQEAIVICDLQDRVRSWNDGAEKLYGISQSQAIGQNVCDLLFNGDSTEWDKDRNELASKGGVTTQRSRALPNGQEVVIEKRRSLIYDEKEEPTAQLLFIVDITDRVREEMKERRTQRLESIGTLAGGIAHDLNNVLTPIVMSAKLLRRGSKTPERLIDNIITSADRGARMIKKLLAFAGGEGGERTQVDLREVLAEVEEMLSHTLQQTIDLQVKVPDKLRKVTADSTELTQVIMNLAINARDAMPGGGRIEIQVENCTIESLRAEQGTTLSAGPYVLLTVADNGQGIPKEIVDRIFDPFFTTKKQGKGTGLGLATTLGIVRSYGGDISVTSEPGAGSKFAIYLPSSKLSAELAQMAGGESNPPSGNGETILIVDDEEMILETARETLESSQYIVLTASSGAEALAIFQRLKDRIDLVLLDMMMPGMDGFETKDTIRSIDPHARIIACSGLRRPSSEGGRMQDTEGFLAKPYTDVQLLRLVRNILSKLPIDTHDTSTSN